MNARERFLAIAVLATVVLAGLAVMAYQFFLVPLKDRERSLAAVTKEIEAKQQRIDEIQAKRVKLNAWRQLSLPADISQASRQYVSYLENLMTRSRFAPGRSITPKTESARTGVLQSARRTEPPFTKLVFDVTATATLDNLMDLLENFYHTSLLHKIDKLTIQRQVTGGTSGGQQQRSNNLNIRMTIEALVLSGAEKRPDLMPSLDKNLLLRDVVIAMSRGPAGLALLPWAVGITGPLGPRRLAADAREYAAIAGKNIFYGAEPVERKRDAIDITQFVFLTDITKTVSRTEAMLYNRYMNRPMRLRETPGWNTFIIKDDDDEPLVQATVLRIDHRDVYFKVGEKYYAIHMDQSIQDAMKRPLKGEEMKVLGVAATTTSQPAAAQ